MIVLDNKDVVGITRCYSNLYPAFSIIDTDVLLDIASIILQMYTPCRPIDNLPIYIATDIITRLFNSNFYYIDTNIIDDYISDIEDILFKQIVRIGGTYDQQGIKGRVDGRLFLFSGYN